MAVDCISEVDASNSASVFPTRIELSGATLVARGAMRLVYEHPAYPNVLIKVFRPDRITPDGEHLFRKHRVQFKLRRRAGAHLLSQREFIEYLSFQARYSCAGAQRPIAAVHGLVQTDLGLGLVVERMTDACGKIAPTLRSLLREGAFNATHRNLLTEFFRSLEERHICVNDLHTANIVLVESPGHAARFVAVDGIGLRSAIPWQDWFKWINAKQVRKRAARVWQEVEIKLNKARLHTPLPSIGAAALPAG